MSKVLWLSDGGCHTGFGRVTHEIGERLVLSYGHEIHVLATNHKGDDFPSILDKSQKTPLWLYRPNAGIGEDIYGNSRIIEMLGKVEPDVVFMLNDPQVLLGQLFKNNFDGQRFLLRDPMTGQMRKLLFYVPCDGYNLPPDWTEILPKAGKVVCMSKFGQRQYEGSDMVYHGVDPDKFWPVREKPITMSDGTVIRSKKEAKRKLNLDPDGFMVLRVDTNSGRKDYASLVRALVPVMRRHSEVQAWFHCGQDASSGAAATNLNVLISRYQDEISGERFFFPDLHNTFIGWSDEDMNALFAAADLFVSTSRGEGFGLTLAEAAMTETPIIAQDCSSITEVVGPGGRLVEPGEWLTVPSGEDVRLANVDAFTDEIERLYQSAGARRDLGRQGREHVLSSFSWDEAAKRFDELIQGLVHERPSPAAGSEVLTP